MSCENVQERERNVGLYIAQFVRTFVKVATGNASSSTVDAFRDFQDAAREVQERGSGLIMHNMIVAALNGLQPSSDLTEEDAEWADAARLGARYWIALSASSSQEQARIRKHRENFEGAVRRAIRRQA